MTTDRRRGRGGAGVKVDVDLRKEPMYHFSRAIYRELADDIVGGGRLTPDGLTAHEHVLKACESVVLRLATDRHYFAKPTKTLFNDIRLHLPISAQCRAYRVVDHYVGLCIAWLELQPATGFDLMGNRLECRATTRKGRPCQRIPQPHNGYCPSHQHLAEEPAVAMAA